MKVGLRNDSETDAVPVGGALRGAEARHEVAVGNGRSVGLEIRAA